MIEKSKVEFEEKIEQHGPEADSVLKYPMEKRVLVIEDESDVLTYLLAVLEDQGLQADTLAYDAALAEGVALVDPDLILLDVMMPERSGISIYEELRTTPGLRKIPVII